MNIPKDLRVIDIDLITDLKRAGKHKEAKEMLKVFYKDVKKTGEQALKDYEQKTRRIRKHLNLCINIDCNNTAEPDKTHCKNCMEIIKYNNKKRYHEKKEKSICIRCGKKSLSGKVRCNICQEYQKKYNKRYRESHRLN